MDTSALMMPVECDIRVFEEVERLVGEYEPIVPKAVIEELETLAGEDEVEHGDEQADEQRRSHGVEPTAASVGRDLATRCTIVETEATYADDALVELAEHGTCEYVVTNDGPLRKRLTPTVGVIGLRGRNELAIH